MQLSSTRVKIGKREIVQKYEACMADFQFSQVHEYQKMFYISFVNGANNIIDGEVLGACFRHFLLCSYF